MKLTIVGANKQAIHQLQKNSVSQLVNKNIIFETMISIFRRKSLKNNTIMKTKIIFNWFSIKIEPHRYSLDPDSPSALGENIWQVFIRNYDETHILVLLVRRRTKSR